MSAHAFAAVDLGATSGRVVVGQVGRDELMTTTMARFPNAPVRTPDGLHWDLLGLYGAAIAGLKKAHRFSGGLRSVGVDSWGVDYALLSGAATDAGRILGNPFHYRDIRTDQGVAMVHSRMPRATLFRRNGLQVLPINTVYQLASEPRGLLELADGLLFIPDLVGYWLTGVARAERTIASTSGLLRASTGEWDDQLFATLGLPRRLMPDLIDPGETLGALMPEVSDLIEGPTVEVTAVGSHDTASAVVAVPMRAESAVYISCGTWGLVGVEVESAVLTADALAASFTNEAGVDHRIRLHRNVMGLWVLSESVRTWERSGDAIDLTGLLRAAEAITFDVPLFDVNDPRFLTPGDMPARIDAWCLERDLRPPNTHAEYARSIVESLAQAFADAAHEAGRIGRVEVQTIHVVGGGSLNALLCQRIADRAGVAVMAGPVEATSLGNILVQARAAGALSGSLDSLRDLVRRTHAPFRYEPRRR